VGGSPGTGPATGPSTFGTGGTPTVDGGLAGAGGGGYYGGGSGSFNSNLASQDFWGGGGGGSGFAANGVTVTDLAGHVGDGSAVLSYTKAATVAKVPPSAPRNVAATQTGPGQITITWDAPASAGSSPITDYSAGYGNGGSGNGGGFPASARSATFKGLSPGKYQASVGAESAAGAGPRVFVNVTVSSSSSSGSSSVSGSQLPLTGVGHVDRLSSVSVALLAIGAVLMMFGAATRRTAD
jgi:hypothetical protein